MGRVSLIAPVNGENRRYLDAKARRELGMEMLVPDRTLHLVRDPDTRQLQFGALPPGLARKPGAQSGSRRQDGAR